MAAMFHTGQPSRAFWLGLTASLALSSLIAGSSLAHAQSGTYAGAELPVGTGVTVVRATSGSYCLQMPLQGALVHENGPGGTAGAGAC